MIVSGVRCYMNRFIAFLKAVVLAESSLGKLFFDVIALAMAYRLSQNILLWLVGIYCE